MQNYHVSAVAYLPINRNREFYPFPFLADRVNRLVRLTFCTLLLLNIFVLYLPDILDGIGFMTLFQFDKTQDDDTQQIVALVTFFTLLIHGAMITAVFYFTYVAPVKIDFYKLAPFFLFSLVWITELVASVAFLENDSSASPSTSSNGTTQLNSQNSTQQFVFGATIKLVAVVFFVLCSRNYWKNLLWNLKTKPYNIFVFALVLIFFYYLKFIIAPAPESNSGSSQNQQQLESLFTNGDWGFKLFFIATVVVIGVFYEEIIFRFGIFQLFGRRNALTAMVFSSIVFATVHHGSFFLVSDDGSASNAANHYMQLWAYLIPGLLFANFFVFNDYVLFYPIVAHAIHNSFAFAEV